MSYFEKYIKYKNKYLILKNSLQEGGEFDESIIKNEDPRFFINQFKNINSPKEYANSPDLFVALEADNIGLLDKKNTNFWDIDDGRDDIYDAIKITDPKWKKEITVMVTLLDGTKHIRTGRVDHAGRTYVIINVKPLPPETQVTQVTKVPEAPSVSTPNPNAHPYNGNPYNN